MLPKRAGIEIVRVPAARRCRRGRCRAAQPGDVVLLSPACTSFDAYPNFERRGIDFRDLVSRLPQGARP